MIDQGEACRTGCADVRQIAGALQPGASMVEWKTESFAFRKRPSADPAGGFNHKHAEAKSPQAVGCGDPGAAGPNDDDLWRRRGLGGFHERLIRSLVVVAMRPPGRATCQSRMRFSIKIEVSRSDRGRKAEIRPARALSFALAFSAFYAPPPIADAVRHQREKGLELLGTNLPERM